MISVACDKYFLTIIYNAKKVISKPNLKGIYKYAIDLHFSSVCCRLLVKLSK